MALGGRADNIGGQKLAGYGCSEPGFRCLMMESEGGWNTASAALSLEPEEQLEVSGGIAVMEGDLNGAAEEGDKKALPYEVAADRCSIPQLAHWASSQVGVLPVLARAWSSGSTSWGALDLTRSGFVALLAADVCRSSPFLWNSSLCAFSSRGKLRGCRCRPLV